DLVWGIESGLAALNVPSPRAGPPEVESTLPIEVRAVLHSSIPGQGVALLAPTATSQPQAFREGDALAPQMVLRRITPDGIELWRDGSIEKRTLGLSRPAASDAGREPPASESAPATAHRAVPIHLDRERVLVLLSDRIGLAEALEPVPMTAGGHRQLRISRVESGSLYDLLGFESGDVLLGVNEQPVHEGDNPLWEALEQEDEVRVRVMRPGGLARHFTYRFSAPGSGDGPR
ncbi:MAG TPA: hypothetical protein VLT59_17190, partial [Steroidobacteraceae bacterium]|nr:hypothetical protein [Steroidobacteraceae bacterium]